jgi:hypothetical protein
LGFESRHDKYIFLCSTTLRPIPEPHSALSNSTGSCPGALGEGKCPSHEHKYSPTTTAKVKNEWSYTFTPRSLHGEVLNKHKKLTLYLYINPLKPSGHYTYRTVVPIRTAQWSLYVQHSGHYMYHQFNIQQLYVLPTQCIYVFCVDLKTNSDYFPIQH